MALSGTCMIVHNKPVNHTYWVHHGTLAWYIVPLLENYMYMQWYMPATGILQITDTIHYIPKAFTFPEKSTKYYLQQAIGDTISIIKDPSKTLPFLSYVNATKMRLIRFLTPTVKYSSASLAKFTIASNVTTESESKSLATKSHQHTCTISKGGTSCATFENANTNVSNHIISKV